MDINQDGNINIIDVIDILNIVLSEQVINDEILCSYDLNSDLTVNIIDIIVLVNVILGNNN